MNRSAKTLIFSRLPCCNRSLISISAISNKMSILFWKNSDKFKALHDNSQIDGICHYLFRLIELITAINFN